MSTMQRITLIGLYSHEPTLFDNMILPTGYNKDTLIETLMLEHGEKCVMYPEPEFMKYSIGIVSRKWQLELERIYEALTAEYNPIWNYDRHEEIDDKRDKNWGEKTEADYDSTLARGTTDTRIPGLTEKTQYGKTDTNEQIKAGHQEQKTDGYTEQKTNGYTEQTTAGYNETDTGHKAETEELVSAFNSSTYEPSKKVITDNGKTMVSSGKVETSGGKVANSIGKIETDIGKTQSTLGGSDTVTTTGTDKTEHTGKDTTTTKGTLSDRDGAEDETNEHRAHIWGNIGVTTSASMVSEVVRQRLELNLYETAAGIFAKELLLQIY